RPHLLCMDEPTMGLSPLYVDRVLELIQAVNRDGVTIFMVEQNASLALAIADHGYVLQTGRIMLSGSANELMRDPRIRDAYLGGETTKAL
ncbi:MAG TPA: ABC transporter ATP-binding protein, partial [Acetobacteraceae bacterium]|nr:ABC transporter ATP-binding protein [Acetobacteraceae bacterium]